MKSFEASEPIYLLLSYGIGKLQQGVYVLCKSIFCFSLTSRLDICSFLTFAPCSQKDCPGLGPPTCWSSNIHSIPFNIHADTCCHSHGLGATRIVQSSSRQHPWKPGQKQGKSLSPYRSLSNTDQPSSSQFLNDLIADVFLAPPHMSTSKIQRANHNAHHRYLGTKDDPDHGEHNNTSLRHYRVSTHHTIPPIKVLR